MIETLLTLGFFRGSKSRLLSSNPESLKSLSTLQRRFEDGVKKESKTFKLIFSPENSAILKKRVGAFSPKRIHRSFKN